jgi:hypothetical protein
MRKVILPVLILAGAFAGQAHGQPYTSNDIAATVARIAVYERNCPTSNADHAKLDENVKSLLPSLESREQLSLAILNASDEAMRMGPQWCMKLKAVFSDD